MSRTGLLGGSFSPPTIAHLSMATFAKSQFNLDKILIMPCSVPTFDKAEKPIEPNHRFNMSVLACFGVPWLEVDDFELKKNPTYSYETLEHLKKIHPKDDLFFIGGSDSLSRIHEWREPATLVKLTDFIVVPRNDGFEKAKEALIKAGKNESGILMLDFPRNDISSTIIRERLKKGFPCEHLVDNAVLDYIKANNLYSKEE